MRPIDELPEEIVPHVNFMIGMAEDQPSAATLDKLTFEISRHYRALGICVLLTDADVDGFFHWLIQSALTRVYYLRRCRHEGLAGTAGARASLLDGFLDAVAAGQVPLAREIVNLSAERWMEGEEYEDDFAWARALGLLALGERDSETGTVLDQFQRALEGGKAVRLDVGQAMLAKDQEAFDRAFDALIREHQEANDRLADPEENSILADEYPFEPNRQVFVEGLAVLRLAESRGLKTRPEYPRCPRPARVPRYAAFQSLGYPGLGLESA
jgi:hypothetical protein